MDSNQALFAMYAIGEVESGWNWSSVNYSDPITLGMMQWYGTRAADLLSRIKQIDPDGYAILAASLRADMDSHAPTDGWWTTRYVTRTEGESWAKCAQRPQNHQAQQDLFVDHDIPAYVSVLTSWGITENNIKTLIFAMSMYHQGPKYCGQVVATVGNTDLDTIWRTCLNHPVLGQYKTRYDTVHARLVAWDGKSAPPDFGQSKDTTHKEPGGDAGAAGGTVQGQRGINYIQANGQNLVIYGPDWPGGLLCIKGIGTTWVPITNSKGTPKPGGTGDTGGGTEPPSSGDEISRMQQLWFDNANKWDYGQGAGRLNPPESHYSDCSGSIWWAINSVNPGKAKSIGTWTGAMAGNGQEIWRGTDAAQLPLDRMRKGDIILIEWGAINYAFNDGNSHVEWYIGDGKIWGAGAAPLPHDSGQATNLGHSGWPALGCLMVRRIL